MKKRRKQIRVTTECIVVRPASLTVAWLLLGNNNVTACQTCQQGTLMDGRAMHLLQ